MTNEEYISRIHAAADFIREKLGQADIAIVLGSGLNEYVSMLQDAVCVDYSDIPGFLQTTVPGHTGRWWCGSLHGRRVYALQGRFHFYEGHEPKMLVMYVYMMKLLGVEQLILTNAAGCVNLGWQPGNLMIMTDFINYAAQNPLIGINLDEFGPRFPDVTHAYDQQMIHICREQAHRLGLSTVREGVYMWFTGPCFETPAQIRMARILGADAVGMSTVPQTIAARHCGIRVLGISCLTNMAAGILDQPLTHQEVVEVADRVKGDFAALLDATIAAI